VREVALRDHAKRTERREETAIRSVNLVDALSAPHELALVAERQIDGAHEHIAVGEATVVVVSLTLPAPASACAVPRPGAIANGRVSRAVHVAHTYHPPNHPTAAESAGPTRIVTVRN
jgi:hypothetical protein